MAMNKDECMEVTRIMRQANDTIWQLRRRVEMLQSKADAFDTIQTLAKQMHRESGGIVEVDAVGRIEEYLAHLDKPEA